MRNALFCLLFTSLFLAFGVYENLQADTQEFRNVRIEGSQTIQILSKSGRLVKFQPDQVVDISISSKPVLYGPGVLTIRGGNDVAVIEIPSDKYFGDGWYDFQATAASTRQAFAIKGSMGEEHTDTVTTEDRQACRFEATKFYPINFAGQKVESCSKDQNGELELRGSPPVFVCTRKVDGKTSLEQKNPSFPFCDGVKSVVVERTGRTSLYTLEFYAPNDGLNPILSAVGRRPELPIDRIVSETSCQ